MNNPAQIVFNDINGSDVWESLTPEEQLTVHHWEMANSPINWDELIAQGVVIDMVEGDYAKDENGI